MNITEFANSRNQQPQTISRYISRHPEFDGHTRRVGKVVELDEEAYALLDEVYPLPNPVTIIEGVPQEEYDKLRDKYEALLEDIRKLEGFKAEIELKQVRIEAESNARQILLEDKEKQVERAEQRADELTQELGKYKKTIFGLYRKESD